MIRRTLSVRSWWFGLILTVGLAVAFYLVLGRGTKVLTTQQLLTRQQTIARAQAANTVSFFQVFGDSIAVLAQLSSMERRDATTIQDMDVFIEQWHDSGLIGEVALTDRRGVVQFNSNILGTVDAGTSLADRDYFAWAKTAKEGQYFVGQLVVSRLGASKGQTIIPVASPVFRNGVFVGVVVVSVKLQPLAERFLDLMKISDLRDVYLVNERREVLYSSRASNMVGVSLFEVLQVSDDFKNALAASQEGKLQTGGRLVAYSPILLDNQNWLLIVSSPVDEVVDFITPMYIRQISILLLTLLTILLFGVAVRRDYGNNRT